MPVTNNNRAVIDTPFWQIMTPPPVASSAGICMTGDSVRFLYAIFSATSFWRYDCYADAWMQLASPPGGTVGVGTCMQWDKINNRLWVMISNGIAAVTFQYYDPATNAWTARSITNLAATMGTDCNMAFPNVTDGAVSSDFIYLIGNASTVLYRYQISTNAWINTLLVQPTACGAGVQLVHVGGFGAGDRIVRIRGGITSTIDYYSIAGNTWTAIAYFPNTETFGAGTGSCKITTGTPTPRVAIKKDATGKVYELDLSGAGVMRMLSTQAALVNGAAVVGNKMDTVVSNGIEYVYVIPHTLAGLVRSLVLF